MNNSKLKNYGRKLITPWAILGYYVAFGVGFAIAYYCNPHWFCANSLTWQNSFYLSAATITTLGYGEVAPVQDAGLFFTALESLLGVLLIGGFLTSLGYWLLEKKERRQIESAKANLRSHYKLWRKDMVYKIVFLTYCSEEDPQDEPKEVLDTLEQPDAFRDYFDPTKTTKWSTLIGNMTADDPFVREMFQDTAQLRSQVNQFVLTVNPETQEVREGLTILAKILGKYANFDLREYYDQEMFHDRLWELMSKRDWGSSIPTKRDVLLELINEV